MGVALPEAMIQPAFATQTNDADPANYIVDIESGTINAYNGLTGAIDNSGTNAASVIQYAINHLTSGRNWKEKVVLKGDMTLTTGLTVPGYTVIEHLGRLYYTGSGSAIVVQNAKNVELHAPFVDLAGAGASAAGIEVQGLWNGDIYSPRVENGGASAVGIKIGTSVTGGQNWGSYVINVYNPSMEYFTGLNAFLTFTTAGDTVGVTHLAVFGGYVHSSGDVFFLRNLASSRFHGMTTAKVGTYGVGPAVNAFNVDNTHDTTFSPGEFESIDGYGYVFGSGCSYVWVDTGDFPIKPAKGLINESAGYYLPNITRGPDSTGSGNHMRLFPSRSDPLYYARFSTNYNYGEVFHLAVKGGGAERKILRWGDAAGLVLGSRKEGPADPAPSDYPSDGDWGIYRNTTNGNVYLVTNVLGTIKKNNLF